jgi:hypothetical protein
MRSDPSCTPSLSQLQGLIKQYKDIYGRMPPRRTSACCPETQKPCRRRANRSCVLPRQTLTSWPRTSSPRCPTRRSPRPTRCTCTHDGPTDAGKLVIEIRDGQASINWPWNGKGWDGSAIPGDDAGLQDRLNRWLHRAEWQGIL